MRNDYETLRDFAHRTLREMGDLANAGFSIALQIGYRLPDYMWTTIPVGAQRLYERDNMILHDPFVMWARQNAGWVDLDMVRPNDDHRVFEQAASFGLRHGVAVSIPGDPRMSVAATSRRSMGTFFRSDRRFTREEAQQLHDRVAALHFETSPSQPIDGATRRYLRSMSESMAGEAWRNP